MPRVGRTAALFLVGIVAWLSALGGSPLSIHAAEAARIEADAREAARFVDEQIERRLAAEKLPHSPQTSDAEFLRRLYLDVHGTIPPADVVAPFLDDSDPDKRAKLVDRLLAGPEYGRWMADIWYRLLIPQGNIKNRVPKELLKEWLAGPFNSNRPWNEIAYELLAAEAPQIVDAPAMLWQLQDSGTLKPEEAADLVAPLFLGVTIRCAQCHDHPFTDLKQDDFWGTAAFFTKLVRDGQGVSNIRGLAERTNPKLVLPPYAKVVPVKFLGGESPAVDKDQPLRPVLAAWVTSPDNPFFAKAMVNRMWAHFLGRGIVNPMDDMQPKNVPTHPELLAGLSDRFIASGFDLKYLVRAITLSETYQRSSSPAPGNEQDEQLYSHKPVKVLSPTELYNSLVTLTMIGTTDEAKTRPRFVQFFTAGDDPLEYDRGIPQLLQIMNSPSFAKRQADLIKQTTAGKTTEEVVELLYLTILARRPSPVESARMLRFVEQADTSREESCGDVMWVLLNSSEFTVNR
jgi:hypothetical protein